MFGYNLQSGVRINLLYAIFDLLLKCWVRYKAKSNADWEPPCTNKLKIMLLPFLSILMNLNKKLYFFGFYALYATIITADRITIKSLYFGIMRTGTSKLSMVGIKIVCFTHIFMFRNFKFLIQRTLLLAKHFIAYIRVCVCVNVCR